MSAVFDASGSGKTASATTSIPDFTVTLAGSSGAVVVILTMSINNATGISVTIGGVSATLISGTDSGTSETYRSLIYGLATGASSGSTTVSISWTGAAWAEACAIAGTVVNQSTPFQNGTMNFSGTGPTGSVTITSATGNLTAAGIACESGGTPSAPTQTSVLLDNAGFQIGMGASYASGAATVSHAFDTGSGWLMSGVDFVAASGGGGSRPMFRGS